MNKQNEKKASESKHIKRTLFALKMLLFITPAIFFLTFNLIMIETVSNALLNLVIFEIFFITPLLFTVVISLIIYPLVTKIRKLWSDIAFLSILSILYITTIYRWVWLSVNAIHFANSVADGVFAVIIAILFIIIFIFFLIERIIYITKKIKLKKEEKQYEKN